MATREAIMTALYAKIAGAYAWETTTRKLSVSAQITAAQRPYVCVHDGKAESYAWTISPVAKRTFNPVLFIYTDARDAETPGGIEQNAILDALDATLAPAPGQAKQTLGLPIDNCRIKGVPHRYAGDLDANGDAVMIVELEVIAP